jgi:spore germination cell wall hydrolase CwlJ-like protein
MKKLDKLLLVFGYIIVFTYFILAAGKAYGYDENETMSDSRYCMAQNIYFESANQSFAGKLAVAHVVTNRVEDLQFPNSVCGVIYQSKTRINWKGNEVPIRNQCQFSWYCDGKSDEPVDSVTWIKSLYIADLVLTGKYKDITEGALWYHADYIYPYWADELEIVTQIDNHIFYK